MNWKHLQDNGLRRLGENESTWITPNPEVS